MLETGWLVGLILETLAALVGGVSRQKAGGARKRARLFTFQSVVTLRLDAKDCWFVFQSAFRVKCKGPDIFSYITIPSRLRAAGAKTLSDPKGVWGGADGKLFEASSDKNA